MKFKFAITASIIMFIGFFLLLFLATFVTWDFAVVFENILIILRFFLVIEFLTFVTLFIADNFLEEMKNE